MTDDIGRRRPVRDDERARQFGAVLKATRQRRRPYLSQARLAELAGYDHSAISRIEAGARRPSREGVVDIAAALGLDRPEADALLMAAGFSPVSDDDALAWINLGPVRSLGSALVTLPPADAARLADAVALLVSGIAPERAPKGERGER